MSASIPRVSFEGRIVRGFAPIGMPSNSADAQEWLIDHMRARWSDVQKLNAKYVAGEITGEQWYTAFDELLMEGHANSWWIGRAFAGDDSDFGDADVLAGRGFKDAESDHLIGFLNDLEAGRYIDADGNPMLKAINARARLYVGKMRGVSTEAFIDTLPAETLFTWKLGGVELHCTECPEWAEILIDVPKNQLPTSPGLGDTPCLGNCLCHLESVVSGVRRVGPMAASLPYDNEDFNQTAA